MAGLRRTGGSADVHHDCVGADSKGLLTGRTASATAQASGQIAKQFSGDHGGYLGEEFGPGGNAKAFAVTLHEVLDGR